MNVAASLLSRARSAPDRPALTAQGRTWSYGELASRAARIAGGQPPGQ